MKTQISTLAVALILTGCGDELILAVLTDRTAAFNCDFLCCYKLECDPTLRVGERP